MKIETITLEVLKVLGACSEGIEFFQEGKLEGFPVSRLDEIKGDYCCFISWMKLKNLSCIESTDSGFIYKHEDGYIGTHDKAGNCLVLNSPDGFSWERTYDCHGNCLAHKDSDGFSWEKSSSDYPVLPEEEFVFFSNGQLQSVRLGDKVLVEFPLI